MKKNKSRLFMTVLATAMGCAFLIVLASVGFGLQKSIVDKMIGDRVVTAIEVWGREANGKVENALSGEDLDYLRSIKHVKAVTYRNYLRQGLPMTVDGAAVPGGGGTIAVDFDAETKAGFGLSAGRLPQAADEVVIGYNIREEPSADGQSEGAEASPKPEYPPAKELIGKKLQFEVRQLVNGAEQITPMTVTIVGVTSEPAREWKKDKSVYIGEPVLRQIESITGTQLGEVRQPEAKSGEGQAQREQPKLPTEPREYNQVQVIADSAQYVKDIGEEIRLKGYLNHSIANELKQVNMVFLIMKIGLVFVGTIAVLIASIGIFNTMTMAVTERAQDIGIMKAIGAHPSAIRRIFLLESAFIGFFGAVIGIIVSYVLSIAVNAALPILIQSFLEEKVPADFRFSLIPPMLVVLAAVISLGVAILSGSRPAKRATKVDVLRALRRDV